MDINIFDLHGQGPRWNKSLLVLFLTPKSGYQEAGSSKMGTDEVIFTSINCELLSFIGRDTA